MANLANGSARNWKVGFPTAPFYRGNLSINIVKPIKIIRKVKL